MPPEDIANTEADRERLRHMLVAAQDAEFFAAGRSRADLDSDRMFARAVLHAIQEIGEAAARTSEAGRSRAAQLPWGSIVQMRHILVHAYFNVNFDFVWRVIERDLAPLIEALKAALASWPECAP
jgi:uncharacterized protein with HEPN domain